MPDPMSDPENSANGFAPPASDEKNGAPKPEKTEERVARKRNPKVQMSKEPFGTVAMPMGYDEICAILPHRFPFLLVDKIVELEPGVRCVGVKNVSAGEDFVQGHFPGHPIMPGVLLLEHMAQVAGVLTLVSRNTPGALSYFAAIETARFRLPVRPGDQVITEATLEVLRGPYCKVNVVGRVDGQVVVEAACTFMTGADGSSSSIVAHQAGGASAPAPLVATTPQTRITPIPSVPSAAPAAPASTSAPVAAPQVLAPSNGAGSGVAPSVHGSSGRTSLAVPRTHEGATFIHPTALVDPSARLEEGVWIGPLCLVEGNVEIGAGTILESNVTLKSGTRIGRRCRIFPHVVLGGDPQDGKFKGEPSLLTLGDDNILREMVTIHRATGEGQATSIGSGNMLMAYAHVGHNCSIGSNNLISNSTGIAGHVTIEDKVVIGGFVGVHQFVHIGKMAMIGGVSKVVQDVPPFCMADGRPAKTRSLNIRGLRRNGVSSEERTHVATAVRLLYRSSLNTTEALARIHAEIPRSPSLDYLVNFIERVREGKLGRQDETPHL
jgi:UDP-N-acetylglucosamine acyltransferase